MKKRIGKRFASEDAFDVIVGRLSVQDKGVADSGVHNPAYNLCGKIINQNYQVQPIVFYEKAIIESARIRK